MNNRWTVQEESKLLKLLASGKTCKELTGGFNRSENALELRVKKIIYENITKGKEPERISTLLNYPKDKVMQYYYSYKDYIGKQQGGNIGSENNRVDKITQLEMNMNQEAKQNINGGSTGNTGNTGNNMINNIKDIKGGNGGNNGNNGISGNSGISKFESIENQNKNMKLIIENYILKQKLAKLLKTKNHDLYRESIKTLLG